MVLDRILLWTFTVACVLGKRVVSMTLVNARGHWVGIQDGWSRVKAWNRIDKQLQYLTRQVLGKKRQRTFVPIPEQESTGRTLYAFLYDSEHSLHKWRAFSYYLLVFQSIAWSKHLGRDPINLGKSGMHENLQSWRYPVSCLSCRLPNNLDNRKRHHLNFNLRLRPQRSQLMRI